MCFRIRGVSRNALYKCPILTYLLTYLLTVVDPGGVQPPTDFNALRIRLNRSILPHSDYLCAKHFDLLAYTILTPSIV